jgi:hypothetical protein
MSKNIDQEQIELLKSLIKKYQKEAATLKKRARSLTETADHRLKWADDYQQRLNLLLANGK